MIASREDLQGTGLSDPALAVSWLEACDASRERSAGKFDDAGNVDLVPILVASGLIEPHLGLRDAQRDGSSLLGRVERSPPSRELFGTHFRFSVLWLGRPQNSSQLSSAASAFMASAVLPRDIARAAGRGAAARGLAGGAPRGAGAALAVSCPVLN